MNLTDTFHTYTQNLPQNVKAVLSIEGGEGIYSLSALRNYHRLGVKNRGTNMELFKSYCFGGVGK